MAFDFAVVERGGFHQRQVELAPDRNTYTVSDMPTTRGGNVIDVLRTVPSVDVDIDNIVSLRGNAGVSNMSAVGRACRMPVVGCLRAIVPATRYTPLLMPPPICIPAGTGAGTGAGNTAGGIRCGCG